MPDEKRRWEAYEALRHGNLTQRDLVHDWRISRQAVSETVLWLVKNEALAEIPGCGTPKRYQVGPRAERYEDLVKAGATLRGGRLTTSSENAGVEVHRGGLKVKVVDGPSKPVPWTKQWVNFTTKFAHMWHMFASERYYFKLSEGKRSSTLEVSPPRRYIWNSWEVERAAAERKRRTVLAVRAFAREFGFVLQGPILQHQPDEFALAAPGMEPMGDPRTDDVWVDESKGEGKPEIESANAKIIARVKRLPTWQDATDKRLNDIELAIHDITDRQARLTELLEKETNANGVNVQLIATEAAHRLNSAANGGGHA